MLCHAVSGSGALPLARHSTVVCAFNWVLWIHNLNGAAATMTVLHWQLVEAGRSVTVAQ